MKIPVVIARGEDPLFHAGRLFRALIVALAMCSALLGLLFLALLAVYTPAHAAELTIMNARWIFPVSLGFVFPSLLFWLERKRQKLNAPSNAERKNA